MTELNTIIYKYLEHNYQSRGNTISAALNYAFIYNNCNLLGARIIFEQDVVYLELNPPTKQGLIINYSDPQFFEKLDNFLGHI